MKQDNVTVHWNSTNQILTLTEKRDNFTLEIFYLSSKDTRVIKENNQKCFVTKIREKVNPTKYLRAMKLKDISKHTLKYKIAVESDAAVEEVNI